MRVVWGVVLDWSALIVIGPALQGLGQVRCHLVVDPQDVAVESEVALRERLARVGILPITHNRQIALPEDLMVSGCGTGMGVSS